MAENPRSLEHGQALASQGAKSASEEAAPHVAILLAAYNGMEWIDTQLDSLLKQTGVRTKIYICVDPSTDDTLAWCQEVASRNPAVEVLHFNKHSGGAASNFFRMIATVDFSAFDYVSLTDQDDVWLPGKLARAHEMLSRTGADGYSSNVIAFWADGRKVLVQKSQPQVKWDFLFEAAGPGCTYVMRRGLAQAVQSLVRSKPAEIAGVGLHDWFVYAFARAQGWQWFIDDHAGMLYRQHDSNLVGVNSGTEAFRHRARQVLGGWALDQSRLIAKLIGLGDDPFVVKWSQAGRSSMLWLAMNAWQCRRRWRDKVIFFLSCMALAVVGHRGC